MLCANASFSQSKHPNQKELFGNFNVVDSFGGNLTDIMLILDDNDQDLYLDQLAKLKQCYEEYSTIPMDDILLDEMLDISKENYEVWDNIRKSISPDTKTAMVIRSILMSMKSKL